MSWNHRVLAHISNDTVYLEIHRVYYDSNGIPNGYSENAVTVGADDLKGMRWVVNKMEECLKKPILWAGDKFPAECKVVYTCEWCGRNKFDRPMGHKCNNGHRKRNLKWKVSYE